MLHRRQRFGVERRIPGITNGVTKAPSARDRHALIRVGIRIGAQDAAIRRPAEIEDNIVGMVRIARDPADGRSARPEMVEAKSITNPPSNKVVGARSTSLEEYFLDQIK
jgi:hypothetical protein